MELADIAPELRARARWMPPIPIGSAAGRWLLRAASRLVPKARLNGVMLRRLAAAGVPLRVYVPDERLSQACLLWIHGGGYVIGSAAQDDRFCGAMCSALGLVVVSVDYRLAPENPAPAPLNDCYAAWQWLQGSADALGIDARRIAVGGQSAGGGLAAGLVQRVHDAGGNAAKAQWLFCPMLDDRTAARRELDALGHFIWDNRSNEAAWRLYLGQQAGLPSVLDYAVPARRNDLADLPPAWIGVGSIDLFFEECRCYGDRLRAAGVDIVFEAVTGGLHGFETWAANTALAADFLAKAQAWLQRAVAT